MRDKYSQSFYTVFICSCVILIVLDFVLIGTGAEFSGLPIFRKGESNGLKSLHKPVIAAIVLFMLIIFLIAFVGICIVRNPPHNACVAFYGFFVFFFGFIPMVAEGGALMGLAKISSAKITEMCDLPPE